MLSPLIKVNSTSGIPKYKQIINSIYHAIENDKLKKGDRIPSINQICNQHSISRDTVFTAYNELRALGIITSYPGKGYFIQSTELKRKEKIFLLFDELNAFKEILYNSFLNAIGDNGIVDIFFHSFNKKMFKNLLHENIHRYTSFVIMPVGFTEISSILDEIDTGNVFILDQANLELGNEFPMIYQNFKKDIYNGLVSGEKQLLKYSKLIMVYPGGKEPKGQLEGFLQFCKEFNFDHEVITSTINKELVQGAAYIVPNDLDMVYLVKQSKKENLKLGLDLGIISYNDTPLKEVVANGITTISTDFNAMGRTLANMILKKSKKQIENPSSLIIRGSL